MSKHNTTTYSIYNIYKINKVVTIAQGTKYGILILIYIENMRIA